MFSEEEKARALEALDECDGCITWAIRKLGYPTGTTMCNWIAERDAGKPPRKRRKWSKRPESVRADALALAAAGIEPAEAAARLGVHNAAIVHNWVRSGKRRATFVDKDNVHPVEGDGHAYDGFDGSAGEKARQLELENDILRGVVEVLKGASLGSLTNREKTLPIDHPRREAGRRLSELTAFLRISKSSYEHQRSAIARGDEYADLRPLAVAAFEASARTRGYRRIAHEPRALDEPVVVSEKVVRRIMAEEGRRVACLKKAKHCNSYEGEISDAPDNLVKRDFHADAPNKLRLSDITEFGIPAGKCHLSPALDCFDGKLASWAVSASPSAELANACLESACAQLAPGGHPVIHTDRGCHYRWPGWLSLCDENGLVRSMSRKACSPDNSAMEGFFGRLKNEFFSHRDWRGVSMEEFMSRLNDYLVFHNEGRVKEALGWLSPSDYRRSLGLAA